MYKWLLILSLSALASPKEFIYCLGQEEKSIHLTRAPQLKKYLNEKMISMGLDLVEGVKLNKRYLQTICKSKEPSLTILKGILKGDKIFINKVAVDNQNFHALARNSIENFRVQSIYTFFKYLSLLQNQNQDVKCFAKFFPKIKKVLDETVHVLEETQPELLLKKLGNIDRLFKRIDQYPINQKKC